MKLEELFLSEGPQDVHNYKAVFMAGGPGSGKSYVANFLRSGTGLKYINVDDFVEMLAPKHGVDLEKGYPEEAEFYQKTRDLFRKRRDLGIEQRRGILIDGTGARFDQIKKLKERLEDIGYDIAMVYVDVDLETAINRNKKRSRKVDLHFLKNTHKMVKDNIQKYAQMFGLDFIIVDNSDPQNEEHKQYLKKNHTDAWKKIRKFLSKPNAAAVRYKETGQIQ